MIIGLSDFEIGLDQDKGDEELVPGGSGGGFLTGTLNPRRSMPDLSDSESHGRCSASGTVSRIRFCSAGSKDEKRAGWRILTLLVDGSKVELLFSGSGRCRLLSEGVGCS